MCHRLLHAPPPQMRGGRYPLLVDCGPELHALYILHDFTLHAPRMRLLDLPSAPPLYIPFRVCDPPPPPPPPPPTCSRSKCVLLPAAANVWTASDVLHAGASSKAVLETQGVNIQFKPEHRSSNALSASLTGVGALHVKGACC